MSASTSLSHATRKSSASKGQGCLVPSHPGQACAHAGFSTRLGCRRLVVCLPAGSKPRHPSGQAAYHRRNRHRSRLHVKRACATPTSVRRAAYTRPPTATARAGADSPLGASGAGVRASRLSQRSQPRPNAPATGGGANLGASAAPPPAAASSGGGPSSSLSSARSTESGASGAQVVRALLARRTPSLHAWAPGASNQALSQHHPRVAMAQLAALHLHQLPC